MQLFVSRSVFGKISTFLHVTFNLSIFPSQQTIGLHELNEDGTEALDQFNHVTLTYDNFDVMSNARIFTGFVFTNRRGNVEELFRSAKSRFSPMRIDSEYTCSNIDELQKYPFISPHQLYLHQSIV